MEARELKRAREEFLSVNFEVVDVDVWEGSFPFDKLLETWIDGSELETESNMEGIVIVRNMVDVLELGDTAEADMSLL